MEAEVIRKLRSVFSRKFTAVRTRYHGSFHLGQVLYTGKDFVLLMSEGEAARSAADRRVKRSPLRDVASLLRSLHYAAAHEFATGGTTASVRREDMRALEPWARFWRTWVSAAFLQRYLATAAGAPFVPQSPAELAAGPRRLPDREGAARDQLRARHAAGLGADPDPGHPGIDELSSASHENAIRRRFLLARRRAARRTPRPRRSCPRTAHRDLVNEISGDRAFEHDR